MMHIPRDTHAAPVLGLYALPGAQAYYRLALPLGVLGGAVTQYDASPVEQGAARTVVLSRIAPMEGAAWGAGPALVARLRGDGRRVLVDADDAIDHEATRTALTQWTPRGRAHVEAMIGAADGVICTNEALAERLRPLNPDVRIVPNYVRPADWPEPAPPADGPPWVLLTGSASHDRDWREAEAALRRLRPFFRLRVVGHLPRYLAGLCDEHRPWGAFEAYQGAIAGCAVALCPLPDTPFNRCKSPIKLYEAALSGCAVVGSETQYGPVLRAAGLGHAVAGRWSPILHHYLTDPEARARDAAALRAYVVDALDVERHAETIRAAYAA
jgi:glycosyltransferase involved in cell wall biosynthesis